MVKLKRMLGDIDDPTVVVLMALIESQREVDMGIILLSKQ